MNDLQLTGTLEFELEHVYSGVVIEVYAQDIRCGESLFLRKEVVGGIILGDIQDFLDGGWFQEGAMDGGSPDAGAFEREFCEWQGVLPVGSLEAAFQVLEPLQKLGLVEIESFNDFVEFVADQLAEV